MFYPDILIPQSFALLCDHRICLHICLILSVGLLSSHLDLDTVTTTPQAAMPATTNTAASAATAIIVTYFYVCLLLCCIIHKNRYKTTTLAILKNGPNTNYSILVEGSKFS